MKKSEKDYRMVMFIKLITHIVASVIILTNIHNRNNLQILVFAVAVTLLNANLRDYFHIKDNLKSLVPYSLFLEVVIVAFFFFTDHSGAFILYYMVCISEATISLDRNYSLILLSLVCSLLLTYLFWAYWLHSGQTAFWEAVVSDGVSIAFTYIMSYMVKLQFEEKEKIARANKELEEAYQKVLENAVRSSQLSIEQERTRMAREIHDTLAHTLTGLVVQLEACKRLLSKDPEKVGPELLKAQESVREGLNEVRRSIKDLRPKALETRSLFDAINLLVYEMESRTGVEIEIVSHLQDTDMENIENHAAGLAVSLYRVIQESITNSVRHGAATHITIGFAIDNSNLKVSIKDNGTGCAVLKKGFGLQGITERVHGLKGNAAFQSSKGNGFETILLIPIDNPVKEMNLG